MISIYYTFFSSTNSKFSLEWYRSIGACCAWSSIKNNLKVSKRKRSWKRWQENDWSELDWLTRNKKMRNKCEINLNESLLLLPMPWLIQTNRHFHFIKLSGYLFLPHFPMILSTHLFNLLCYAYTDFVQFKMKV
jgi:hypothetical protein